MNTKYARARFGAAILVAFVCGLVFASGFDLTRFSWAQAKVTSRPTAQQVQPLVETENAFEAVADHVKPAVVSISTQRNARPVSRQVTPRGRNGQRLPPGMEDFFRQFDMPDQADQ